MISSPIYKQRARALPLLLAVGVACGGSAKPAERQPAIEPAADPSTRITVKSASKPNRNSSSTDLGHGGAETFNKPIDDCELPQCIGEAPQSLVDAIRTQAGEARRCYEDALKSTPKVAGRFVVMMRVTHEGKSCPIRIATNELAESQTLVPCVRRVLERSYPKPHEGCVDLQLPLRFVPEFIEPDAGTTSPGAKD